MYNFKTYFLFLALQRPKKMIKLVTSLLSNTIFGIFNFCSSKQMAILESDTRLETIGMILEEIVEFESLIFLT